MRNHDDIESRLRALEDKLEILGLYTAYAIALDDKDKSLMSAVFDEDSEFECLMPGVPSRSGIEGNWNRLMQRHEERRFVERHLTTAPVITWMDAERAEAYAECVIVKRDDGGAPEIESIGRYEDVLTRRNGRWLFAKRRFVPDA